MAELKLTGGPELERALRELGGKIASRLGSNAVRAGARVVAAEARARVPKRSGDLKRSIRIFTDPKDRRGSARTAYAGTRLFYGWFVEFGTAHSSARPFLRPALDEAGQAAVNKMVENLGRGIERETLKYKGRK